MIQPFPRAASLFMGRKRAANEDWFPLEEETGASMEGRGDRSLHGAEKESPALGHCALAAQKPATGHYLLGWKGLLGTGWVQWRDLEPRCPGDFYTMRHTFYKPGPSNTAATRHGW